MSRWSRRSTDGETICAICGAEKGNRTSCCKTAPFVDFWPFVEKYFKGESVSHSTAREFWIDYLTSEATSLDDYINMTTRKEV